MNLAKYEWIEHDFVIVCIITFVLVLLSLYSGFCASRVSYLHFVDMDFKKCSANSGLINPIVAR